MKCRFCNKNLNFQFIDLVNSPPSNSYLTKDELDDPEIFYPIKLFVCENCFLVQIDEYKKSVEIFNEKYAYFSSLSKSWLDHSQRYVEMVIDRFKLDTNSFVIEIASNDGYLLQYFKKKEINCLGIEPSSNTAAIAKKKGIDVMIDYFGVELAEKIIKTNKKPDLLLGNNVLAHVPDINDFVKGLKILLNEKGVITMEFPHIMKLIENIQFDTIYHEHFSYFSFLTVKSIFGYHNLEVFDVDEISTHGGSLRIYAKHKNDRTKEVSSKVKELYDLEISKKMNTLEFYEGFQEKVNELKYKIVNFLIEQKIKGKKVVAYGAAAKGNTLLNYCGVRGDLIEFVSDLSPFKQGKCLPASHIPIFSEKKIKETRPDYVLILPWNIKTEIMKQLNYIKDWGGKFVIPIPEVRVL